MSDLEARIDGQPAVASPAWRADWIDPRAGILRLTGPDRTEVVVVGGEGTEWFVTLRGRRVPVTVLSWRERVMAEAAVAAGAGGGPLDVKATLPGLVVTIAVREGDEVTEGSPLLTIEAMKMQNEVRAPRDGRVTAIAVEPGRAVATGAFLLRLE